MPKFAANLSLLFNELPFLDRFAAARAAGFEAVEFLFPYAFDTEQIAARLRRYGLELVLHNLPAGDWTAGERGLACDPRRSAEFQDGVGLALDYALELGVRRLHCLAGRLPPNVTQERARAAYVANLRHAAARCREHGITLLIEPINDRDMPGYFLTGTRQAVAIIEEVGAPNLALQYDIYHMQRMEGELAETIRRYLPLIRHVQLADVPGRHQPGTGEINFPFLFRLLDELGYEGWIGCEYLPQGDTVASLGWLEDERKRYAARLDKV
ncbi:hydroxypyruvate isomerase [Massilia sp. BSC265]|uniref:hydroxypyruvate isomerase n=1 Tax=Massilia sp. BSC265 TaxID=1549812 RepID=UPI0004E89116|nr:hydroxypyruvate isomerase [Massilia sp. BSC265]KFI06436.1 hydroxypyruvate isomerase [Massilia sp. BSC265]